MGEVTADGGSVGNPTPTRLRPFGMLPAAREIRPDRRALTGGGDDRRVPTLAVLAAAAVLAAGCAAPGSGVGSAGDDVGSLASTSDISSPATPPSTPTESSTRTPTSTSIVEPTPPVGERVRDHGAVTAAGHPTAGWVAPSATGSVRATVTVPGSKSLTNRALLLAAQATGPSTLVGALRSRDTELMAAGLRALGQRIDDDGDTWRVTPQPRTGPAAIDCGLAGTVMRFLPALAATATGAVHFDGDPAARRRPMATTLQALRALGATIVGTGLPFTVHGIGRLAGGIVRLDASASSQFVSGLLLCGASYERGVEVIHDGPPVPSAPHIAMTVEVLRSVGVAVDDTTVDRWRVEPGPVDPWTTPIEPDLSNATPFLAAAAVTAGVVTVPGWPAATTQAGDAIRGILTEMGCAVERLDRGLRVAGPDALRPVDLDLHDVGELTPTVAALALFADGVSRLRGIAHLRGHETDRLAALAADIAGLGGDVEQHDDGLTIRPAALHGGPWASYADHRMATAGAIVGLRVPGVVLDDIDTTAKTLPGFGAMWLRMLDEDAVERRPAVAS